MSIRIKGVELSNLRRMAQVEYESTKGFWQECVVRLIDAYARLYRETEELRQGVLFGAGQIQPNPKNRRGV